MTRSAQLLIWTDGGFTQGAEYLKIDNAKEITRLEEVGPYKFLGVLENVKQEDRMVLQNAARCTCKGYLLFVLSGWHTTTELVHRTNMLYQL